MINEMPVCCSLPKAHFYESDMYRIVGVDDELQFTQVMVVFGIFTNNRGTYIYYSAPLV